MFRLNQYLKALDAPSPKAVVIPQASPRPGEGAPVVIWNLLRRCNLNCIHCYSTSTDTDFREELSRDEIFAVLEDLHASGVRILILSGGEPLMHPDIFAISERATEMGFFTALSTNGTFIDAAMARRIAGVGYDYVGISIDGIGETHDRFRRQAGAYAQTLRGVRHCRDEGIKVGLRFTLARENAHDLPGLLQLVDEEGINKFYLSHLNYAGRGNKHREDDALHQTTRRAMELLFETCRTHQRAGRETTFVTGNNDADGPFLLQWVAQRYPDYVPPIREMLVRWGGNASGVNVANIDNRGHVHPDTMWWQHDLGSIRDRSFAEIWNDTSDPLMAGLKQRPRPVKGRCARCIHLDICNGNTRTRAFQLTGDYWTEDPGCYLYDDEIGLGTAEAVGS